MRPLLPVAPLADGSRVTASVHFVLTFWKFITTMFELVRGWRGLDRAARCECADPCLARCDMLSLREWLVVLQCAVVLQCVEFVVSAIAL